MTGVLCFSLRPVLIKAAYEDMQDPVTLIALRMAVALPFFLAMSWWSAGRGTALTFGQWWRIALLGFNHPIDTRLTKQRNQADDRARSQRRPSARFAGKDGKRRPQPQLRRQQGWQPVPQHDRRHQANGGQSPQRRSHARQPLRLPAQGNGKAK